MALTTNMPTTYRSACRSWRAYIKDRIAHPWATRHWPECIAVEGMSRQQLKTLQHNRLQTVVKHAITNVPFYRRWAETIGLDPSRTVQIEQLPIVSKGDYLRNPAAFLSDAINHSSLRTHRTSGSSGEPFAVMNDAFTRDYSYCCLRRALLRHGIRPGDRLVHIWGSGRPEFDSRIKTSVYHLMARGRNWLSQTLPISAYDLSDTTLDRVVRQIERFNPTYIHGYVSALHTIAMHLNAHQRPLRATNLKLVVNDSEPFDDTKRSVMQQAFGCRVVEHYGCLEVGNIAQEDPGGTLRVNEDYLILEQSDRGEAIVTHLLATAMPFLRYRLGDLITFDDTIASGLPYCGLDSIEGRVTDLLPIARGGFVHGLAIATAVYSGRPYIRRYQIRQIDLDHFQVAIVSDETMQQSTINEIIKSIQLLTGSHSRVDILTVPEIPLEPSGKFRLVVSHVKEQQHA